MDEMDKALDLHEELNPEVQASLKQLLEERAKNGPVRIAVVGHHDAEILARILRRIDAVELVEIAIESRPVQIDRVLLAEKLGDFDSMIRELQRIQDWQTPHDLEVIEAQEVVREKPLKTKVKGFHSNSQFKQQRPAFKNQHQARAMIRPPRRGG